MTTNPINAVKALNVGELRLGDHTVACAVTEGMRPTDSVRRGVSLTRFHRFVGYTGKFKKRQISPTCTLPDYLTQKAVWPYLEPVLSLPANQPFWVELPDDGSGRFRFAEMLPCEVVPQILAYFVKAKMDGALAWNQHHIADRCMELMLALANQQMRDLVDQATGFVVRLEADQVQAITEQNERLMRENAALSDELKALRGIRDMFVDAEGTIDLGIFGKKLRELGVPGAGSKNIFKMVVRGGWASVRAKQGAKRTYYEYEPMQRLIERGCLFPKFRVRRGRKGFEVAATSMVITFKGAVEFYQEEMARAPQLTIVRESISARAFMTPPGRPQRKAVRTAGTQGAQITKGATTTQIDLFSR